ncbi:KH domain-containing protein [bacterium]|nr:KH domain-containing protein [bacterium]
MTDYKELLVALVTKIVDHPDEVVVTEVEGERAAILELRVHESDVGKVIGRDGRIINALRTLVKAAAGRENKRITIELLS